LISDIFRLELEAPGSLIEQGGSMELNITAYDNFNKEFDEDQYKYMEFATEIESLGIRK
jgi:hypothetical protein